MVVCLNIVKNGILRIFPKKTVHKIDAMIPSVSTKFKESWQAAYGSDRNRSPGRQELVGGCDIWHAFPGVCAARFLHLDMWVDNRETAVTSRRILVLKAFSVGISHHIS
ncbi:hypothetical protein BO443_140062 [Burkholderia orbicola]